MIMSLCDTIEVLNIIRIIKIFITIIKIAVPILLLVTSTITYLKAVSSGDLQKPNKAMLSKVIAAVIIFFIPTIVNVIINLAAKDSDINQCLINATGENIASIKVEKTYDLIEKIEENFSTSTYNAALASAKEIEDALIREDTIEKIKEYEKYIDLYKDIDKLAKNYNRNKFKELYEEVENIDKSNIKEKLLEKMEEIGGKPLNVKAGEHTVWLDNMLYVVYIPENATYNMPLIMYLHGDNYAPTNELYRYARDTYGEDFPFIIVAPDSFDSEDWKKVYYSKLDVLKEILDSVCNEYSCDKNRISLAGHSRGAIITWYMVNKYPNYFYSAVPVSCTPMQANASNFKHTKIWAFAGNQSDKYNGSDEINYNRVMSGFVNSINNNGGKAKFTEFDGASHFDTLYLAFTKEKTFEWMIE